MEEHFIRRCQEETKDIFKKMLKENKRCKRELEFFICFHALHPPIENCFPVVYYSYCFTSPCESYSIAKNYAIRGADIVEFEGIRYKKVEERIKDDNYYALYRISPNRRKKVDTVE